MVTLANPNIASEVLSEMRAQLTETNKVLLSTMVEELNLNKKWEEKGLLTGIEQGAISSRREDIIENLKEIGSIDDTIIKKINNEKDIIILKKWVRISARVNSLDEFKIALFEK